MSPTIRENYIRNASLQGHAWIPQTVAFSGAYWHEQREALEEIVLRHPALFPDARRGEIDYDRGIRDHQYHKVDAWGCEWIYPIPGLDGQVIGHPLADWDNLQTWQAPEPVVSDERLAALAETRAKGELATLGLEHGFLFMRSFYLRGFDNMMLDVAAQDPRLTKLIDIIAGHWERYVQPFVRAGLDLLVAGDDLGTQTASILGPRHFGRLLLPAYRRVFVPARMFGAHVYLHHDGYVMDIIDDVILSGVSIVNPQDLVNGIDNIARAIKGRVCIEIDIDRQSVMPFGSPADVRDLVREEVLKLGSPQGGLSMICGVYPPTPLANVEALCSALEEYRTYWVGR
ncbi:MAG: hypothetical protein GX557_16100 [Chloroflexi bacterium]|nr:hypothetical protein [Chloroflexota bacterium]